MIDEREVFDRFHEALDVQPGPGAFDRLQAALTQRPVTSSQRTRFGLPVPGMGLRLAAGLMVAVVVVAGLLYFRSSLGPIGSAKPDKVPPPAGLFAGVSMMTATDGWADLNSSGHLRRTTDGGAHWTDVSPPSAFAGGASTSFFLDASHAWTVDASWTPGLRFVAHRTTDGGGTWQQSSQITVEVVSPSGLAENAHLSLDFLDSEHGWLFIAAILKPQPPASEPVFDALYRTGDGGLHWTLVSTNSWSFIGAPFVSGCPWGSPVFTSLTTGFMITPDRTYEPGKTQNCSTPNGPSLHVTNDGGLTWQFQALSVTGPSMTCPFICVLDAPRFLDRLHGFLMLPTQGGTTLLATSDGGGSWSLRSMPGSLSDSTSIGWLDARNGWAWTCCGPLIPTPATDTTPMTATVPLYRTSDGGATWARVQTNLRYQTADGSVNDIYFVDDKVGFAVRYTEAAGDTRLIRTTDGGLTWTEVGPLR